MKSIKQEMIAAGMSEGQAVVKENLFDIAADRLRLRRVDMDRALHAIYVPGRIEFLGKHTDYAGGRSLICAVDRGICMIATPRTDSLVRVLGETSATDIIFPLESGLLPAARHWSNYPMTVGRRLARNFPGKLKGADIAFTSDLPASSGLSSSSAVIIAFFLALAEINQLRDRAEYKSNIHSPTDLAGYLGTIENGQTFGSLLGDRGVGTFGGSEDHAAIMLGIPKNLSQYSFCPVRLERQVPLPADHTLVIAVSGVIAEKTGAAQEQYNAVSRSAFLALQQWQVVSGRNDATLADAIITEGAAAVRKSITEKALFDRFDQFAEESMMIVPAGADALILGRLDELGTLVDRSQNLAERLLKNQVVETIFLARCARKCGAVAASSFGAGFGGSVWAMVPTSALDGFINRWRSAYESQFPVAAKRANFFPATAGMPAMVIHKINRA